MDSAYTKVNHRSCNVSQSENDGYSSVSICPEYADIKVELRESDIRQDISLIRQGKRYDLQFIYKVSGASSFFGPNIEWRFLKGNADYPVAMISRYIAADEYVDGIQKNVSYLVVTKISENSICIVGKVYPSKDQNIKARKMADKAKMMSCINYKE
jgi:hypothetical protein